MNEQQAFAAVRNAIRLENLSRDVAAKVTPELAVILKQVREMIRTMPPGNLEREIRYRQFQQQLAGMLRGVVETSSSVTISCASVSGATSYTFDIQYVHSGSWASYYTYTTSGPTKTFYPAYDTDYRFRVRALLATQVSR